MLINDKVFELYRKLKMSLYVSENEIFNIILLYLNKTNYLENLNNYCKKKTEYFRKIRKEITFEWIGKHLPGMNNTIPKLAELVAKSLFYRMGPYSCLLQAEDLLNYNSPNLRINGKHDLNTCIPTVLLIYWFMSISPQTNNVTSLFRVEENSIGWGVQFNEYKECSDPHLNICKNILLIPGKVLEINNLITYAGDYNKKTFVDPVTKKLNKNGIPWIWTWRPPNKYHYLRWKIVAKNYYITNYTMMYPNVFGISFAFQKHKNNYNVWKIKKEFGFPMSKFNISSYVPSMVYNEILLKPGTKIRIMKVVKDDNGVTTCTAQQL